MREIFKIIFFFIAIYASVKMWTKIIKEIRGNM